jgi:uncharacterized repeat protein (TIGR01451 family)
VSERVPRWQGALVGTLALTSLGLLYANATLLAAATIPLAYVLYGVLSSVPAETGLRVSREVAPSNPAPGEVVTVETTVENRGDGVLPDVRVVDGVPDSLAVVGGSPRACLALAPGGSGTVRYEVITKQGEYDFDDPVVRLGSLAATERAAAAVPAAGETRLYCTNAVSESPLGESSLSHAGTLATDSGGAGLEFYATREYRPGDPMNRIDWRHYAKTGEFVTVQYREERTVRTVLIVDARPVSRVAPRPGYPTGAELSTYAAERLYDALVNARVVTSVTAVGANDALAELVGPDGVAWVDSDADDASARVGRFFDGVRSVADTATSNRPARTATRMRGPGSTTVVADGGPAIEPLLARLPPTARVVICTPLLDGWPVSVVRALSARGYPQTLLSPDVADGDGVGQLTAGGHRRVRLSTAERAGAATVGWTTDRSIDHALRRSLPHLLDR